MGKAYCSLSSYVISNECPILEAQYAYSISGEEQNVVLPYIYALSFILVIRPRFTGNIILTYTFEKTIPY